MAETTLDRLMDQRGRFVAFVQRRVGDVGVAEDIVQTAYLNLLKHEGTFEHGEAFESEESAVAWFYRLLRNAVIDNYRRQASKTKALEAWARELEMAEPPPAEAESEVCGCFHGALEDLKAEYAAILRAVDLRSQPVREFAEQHGLSASNAGVRIHRARAALRRQLLRCCGSCAEGGCLHCTCERRDRPAAVQAALPGA